MTTIKEIFQCLFIPVVLCICLLFIVGDSDFKMQENKNKIIDSCEQRFIGDYDKIKDCVDFELNYKG